MRRGRRQTKDISTTDASAALPTKSVDASKSNQLQPAAKPFAGFGSFVKASPGSSAPAASTQKEQPKATLSFSKLAASSPAASPKDAAAKPTFSFSKPAVLPPTSSPSFSFGSETKTKPAASSPAASPAPKFSFSKVPPPQAPPPAVEEEVVAEADLDGIPLDEELSTEDNGSGESTVLFFGLHCLKHDSLFIATSAEVDEAEESSSEEEADLDGSLAFSELELGKDKNWVRCLRRNFISQLLALN